MIAALGAFEVSDGGHRELQQLKDDFF